MIKKRKKYEFKIVCSIIVLQNVLRSLNDHLHISANVNSISYIYFLRFYTSKFL